MPLHIYKNKAGKRVSGVTTILKNLGWNRDALMFWAWDKGMNNIDFRQASEEACDAGTYAHVMVEHDLKGLPEPDKTKYTDEVVSKGETAYLAWLEWKDLVNFKLISSELSLISEKYQFGGTIDIAVIKKVPAILDIKTSNNIYSEHKIQIAAYGKLYNENYPDQPIQAYYILQLGKEDGSFSYHYWPNLDNAWEAFLCALKLHQLKKKI